MSIAVILSPMRGLTHRWVIHEPRTGTDAASNGYSGREALISRLLAARSIEPGDADIFLDPRMRLMHDPALLPGADDAARRLLDALNQRESIVIYGDYDVDGMTASAILFHMLRHLDAEARVTTYVPHRLDEGYGLNADAIARLAAEGADVIISVDCGITATGPAATARDAGVDLIITDHHHSHLPK